MNPRPKPGNVPKPPLSFDANGFAGMAKQQDYQDDLGRWKRLTIAQKVLASCAIVLGLMFVFAFVCQGLVLAAVSSAFWAVHGLVVLSAVGAWSWIGWLCVVLILEHSIEVTLRRK